MQSAGNARCQRAPPIEDTIWEFHKDQIALLFYGDGTQHHIRHTAREIAEHLRTVDRFPNTVTLKQVKARLAGWGMVKNVKRAQIEHLVYNDDGGLTTADGLLTVSLQKVRRHERRMRAEGVKSGGDGEKHRQSPPNNTNARYKNRKLPRSMQLDPHATADVSLHSGYQSISEQSLNSATGQSPTFEREEVQQDISQDVGLDYVSQPVDILAALNVPGSPFVRPAESSASLLETTTIPSSLRSSTIVPDATKWLISHQGVLMRLLLNHDNLCEEGCWYELERVQQNWSSNLHDVFCYYSIVTDFKLSTHSLILTKTFLDARSWLSETLWGVYISHRADLVASVLHEIELRLKSNVLDWETDELRQRMPGGALPMSSEIKTAVLDELEIWLEWHWLPPKLYPSWCRRAYHIVEAICKIPLVYHQTYPSAETDKHMCFCGGCSDYA